MPDGETILGMILFSLFALITMTGTFLITDHFRTRKMAVVATLLVAAFFAALGVGLIALVRSLTL